MADVGFAEGSLKTDRNPVRIVRAFPRFENHLAMTRPAGLNRRRFASVEAYIESWVIRLRFRHPMHVQKRAQGHLDMSRAGGFAFEQSEVLVNVVVTQHEQD
ncbi:hypothetical protein [Ralstonia solanacearum]|uniref:Uncharacterized protein n=1 Tax=Ralstonia solanacearum TaxID=305 RepID=A0AAE3NEP2_RALSL|nr:hypothetical protein [Ralstonia solanacearum]MDB0520900.1 hypothetical protein [Ralstonia solanacearum]